MNYIMKYCIRRLISEIEARPIIWDSRMNDYSDRMLKRQAWDELCASFVHNYYESSDAERNGIIATMQTKWKSVRDAFLRELKKSSNPSPGIRFTKQYAYYDNLLFLKPIYEVRQKKDGEDPIFNIESVTVEYDNKDDSDNDNNSRSSSTFTENKPLSAQPKRKRTEEREDKEESVFNMLADHIKNKRKKDGHEDPDRQFLLSLLPDLQSMDPNIKFDLKYEIMTVVKRYKDENLKFVAAYQQE